MSNVQFALAKIVTEQFASIPNVYNPQSSIKISFGLKFHFEREQKLIACSFKVNFSHKESVFLVLEVSTFFQIEENSWNELVFDEGQKIVLPKYFAEHLGVLVVGISRGVLHCKTENTEFNQFILPTIDVRNLVQNDIVFTFEAV